MQRIFVSVLFIVAYAATNFIAIDAATSAQAPYYHAASAQNTNSYGGSSSAFSSASSSLNANSFTNTNKDNKRPVASAPTEKGVLERYTHRYPDGSYEFRYELADGTARYERGYFLLIDNVKSLVVLGYYSYRMPDGRYITVFYNADHNGYRQNQSITPHIYPNLPRSIDVPEFKEQHDYKPAVTTQSPRIPITTTTRRNYF